MIKFLLKEIEKVPAPTFSKKELLAISPQEFERLRLAKIITFTQPSSDDLERVRLPRCQHGCSLTVQEVDGELEAYCQEHPEEDPILIEQDDLSRYTFAIDQFLVQIRTANKIEGGFNKIGKGFYYIGYKTYGDIQVGYVFIPNVGDQKLIKLSGLKTLCKDDDILVILTPVSNIEDTILKGNLRQTKIVQTSLISSLDFQTFKLPIDKLISGLLALEKAPELSRKQKADYRKFDYLCYDKIHVPGEIPMKRSNSLIINDNQIKIGDSLLILLLRFVVELKSKKRGWVNIYDLSVEGIISDPQKYQIYNNLRKAMEGSLLCKDGKKFIQSDKSKNYRISAHPDFITYDRSKLLEHPDYRVRKLAKKLPQIRKR